MLSPTNIETIRKYFLASDENEFRDIQKVISQASFSKYLPDIKSIFNSQVADVASLAIIAKKMGANENMKELLKIQEDYYALQAEMYNTGETNSDMETLLKVRNLAFLREIDFQKELELAFILDEKAEFKKKFKDWDKELEKEKIGHKITFFGRKLPIVKLYLKRLAIAATLIGIILVTRFILLKRTDNKSRIDNTAKVTKQERKEIIANRDLKLKQLNELIATIANPTEEKLLQVLKEKSLGFAPRQEKVTIRIYELSTTTSNTKNLSESGDSRNLTGKQDSIIRNDSISNKLTNKIDSIQNLANKIRFIKDTMSLFVSSKKAIKALQVLQLKSTYYLQINDSFYHCQQSAELLPFISVSDNAILKKLDKIIFMNSN